ncbi:MAG: tellurite resistance TerB family protein [Geminicoccaceae bacterium]
MVSPQEALIHTMVVAAEADREIADAEIGLIGDVVDRLPIFQGVDRAAITAMAARCSDLLAQPGGGERVFGLIREALSPPLRATAYALACDVIAVDRRLNRAEMGVLEEIRAQLEIDPVMARAIEQVAEVRIQAA